MITKARLKLAAKVMAIVTVITSPYWASHLVWRLTPPSDRHVAIINYTAHTADRPGHRGLTWVLNHTRAPSPLPGEPWRSSRDYIGYLTETPRLSARLEDADLGGANWLYVADAYGIYESDIELLEGNRERPAAEGLIFGGLSPTDVDVLEQFVADGHEVVIECNAMTPPTAATERARLETILGAEWTGWAGRVFPDLNDPSDIPEWFFARLQERFPLGNFPTDPCLGLFGPAGEMILTCDPDYARLAPRVQFTDAARVHLGNLRSDAAHFGWFFLVTAHPDTLVLAEMQLPEALIRSPQFHSETLLLRYPALTLRTVGPSRRFGIHLTASRAVFDPGRYNLAGLPEIQALMNRRHDIRSPRPVFWQFWVPALRAILRG